MGRGVFTAAAPSLRDLDAYMPRSRWPWNREPSLIHADIRGTTPEGWTMAVYTVTCGPDTECSNCGKVVCPGCDPTEGSLVILVPVRHSKKLDEKIFCDSQPCQEAARVIIRRGPEVRGGQHSPGQADGPG